MQDIKSVLAKYKSPILWVSLIILVFFLLFSLDTETLKEGLREIKNADLKWIALAILLFFSSIPPQALQLMAIAKKKINFWLTFKVQMALQFVSKLVPASVGSFILNSFLYSYSKTYRNRNCIGSNDESHD